MGAAYLLINNNNSRTKFALSGKGCLLETRAVSENGRAGPGGHSKKPPRGGR